MQSRARQILEKSTSALLAAIEIYNKPNFSYREETFSILAINAWELLFKARILQLSGNRISSVINYERRQLADGSLSSKWYRKQNRSGNHVSIGLFQAHDTLTNEYKDSIPSVVRINLEALCEIRDNAIHFLNKDVAFRKKTLELGTASVKNYLHLLRLWFGNTLEDFQLYLMPIGFVGSGTNASGIVQNAEERNWINYLAVLESSINDDVSNETNLTLDIDIRFKRSSDSHVEVRVTNSPTAVEVKLSEEDVRDQYPWDYDILSARLGRRYSDFKMNGDYHRIRKKLEKQKQYCRVRYLDPGNPRSAAKNFYNPNIVKEFDAHYTRN
jgi:hypothetical protein